MEQLGIDGKLLIAQLINFAIFYYIFKRFLAKPFRNLLSEEKSKDQEREKSLQKIKKLEEGALKKEQEVQEHAKRQGEAIIKDTKQSAEKLKEDIIAQAHQESQQVVEKAQKQINAQKEELYAQVKSKVTELSFLIINSALKHVLSNDLKKKVTEQILKNSTKKVTYEN